MQHAIAYNSNDILFIHPGDNWGNFSFSLGCIEGPAPTSYWGLEPNSKQCQWGVPLLSIMEPGMRGSQLPGMVEAKDTRPKQEGTLKLLLCYILLNRVNTRLNR